MSKLTNDLPEDYAKATDSRKAKFVREIGRDIQVELDALPPDVLLQLYKDKFAEYDDFDVYERILKEEEDEREKIRETLRQLRFLE